MTGNFFNQEGTTPLMTTAAAGHYDSCRELIIQGADPNLRRKVFLFPICLFTTRKVVVND